MKNPPLRFLFSTLAALAFAPLVSARQGANPDVNYSPQAKVVQNLLTSPTQFSYTLGITVPTTIPAGLATSVTLAPGALADPTTGLSSTSAVYDPTQAPSLAYITLSSGSVTGAPGQPIVIPFTGGTSGINVTVTLTFPAAAAAGTYAYFISGTWPTTDGVTPGDIATVDMGATINATVIPPPPSIQILTVTGPNPGTPFVSIPSPLGDTSFNVPSSPTFQVAAGQTTAPVSFTYVGGTPALDIISVSGTVTDSSGNVTVISGLTAAGLQTAGVSGGATIMLSPDTYTLAITDANSLTPLQSASQLVAFTVAPAAQPPQTTASPAVSLTVKDPYNSANTVTAVSGGTGGTASITITIPAGATALPIPYSLTGGTSGGTLLDAITSASLSLNGVTAPLETLLNPTGLLLNGLGSPTVTGTGSLTDNILGLLSTGGLAAGNYSVVVQDNNVSNLLGGGTSASATVNVAVVQQQGPVNGNCSAPTVTATSNFSANTSSCQNNTIWFASTVAVNGLGAKGAILQFNNPAISFSANGAPVTLIAPAAVITFSPTATTAVSTYNAAANTWNTTVPAGYTGNVFLTGLAYQASSRFSASNNPVTWSGSFLGSAPGMSLQWQTSAAVLTQCSSSYNSCAVKPVDAGALCQYQNTDGAGTPENFRSYQHGSACSNGSAASSNGGSSISGLYPTGVNNSGAPLAGKATDAHYPVTASSLGSKYTGSPLVDPAPLAYGWVPNTSSAQWITAPGGINIGNGAGNNSLPASGSASLSANYDYTLTFSLAAGADPGTVSIAGTLSADDSVIILVNGTAVTSGAVPKSTDYEYNITTSFKLNGSNATFQPGANTITFRVANENGPAPANPSGLFIQSLSGTVSAPQNLIPVSYCATLATLSLGSPPTVNPTNPAAGAIYPFAAGSSVSVPAGFTAASPVDSGNITALSATLNGNSLALTTTSGVGASPTATGAATLSISQAGTYTLVYTGANTYGSASATVSFNAIQVQPPTVTIAAPADGSTITLPAGSASAAVPYTLTGGTAYGTIQSVSVTLNGAAVSTSPAIAGLGTASISGGGSLTLTAGTYTLGATDSNGVATGSDQNTFTVVPAANGGGGSGSGGSSGNEYLLWLQQNSCNGQYGYYNNGCNQTVSGGAIVPVAFGLYAGNSRSQNNWNCWSNGWSNYGNFVTDPATVIAIYEIYSNNSSSTPVLYTYGATGPNPPYYSIGNNQYLLEFPTAAGAHHYRVEVYNGNSLQQLGSEDISTEGSCLPTACANGSRFNSGSIAKGNYIWFNSTCNVSGLSSHASTLWFDASTINFTCNNTAVALDVPAACVKFDPNCAAAATTFDASANCWVTVVPLGYTGSVFVCGASYQVPASLPAGTSVTWSGCFRGDTRSVNANWQWSAAVYTQWSANLGGLGVKAVDSSSLCQYRNSDRAGTPETFKTSVTAGACGTGGSNYTGTFGPSLSPSIGSNCWLDSDWN